MENRAVSSILFRGLLERVDPVWPTRPGEEQDVWVEWYARTALAIARQYARSFRDPSHDMSDLLQEILLKIFTKFSPPDAPHRLLTEEPCMRNLMGWKGLDLVDYENAEKRNARRRAPLPGEEIGPAARWAPSPDRAVEMAEEERKFRRAIRDPEERKAYLMFRMGRTPREVAHLLGRRVRDMRRLHEELTDRLLVALKG